MNVAECITVVERAVEGGYFDVLVEAMRKPFPPLKSTSATTTPTIFISDLRQNYFELTQFKVEFLKEGVGELLRTLKVPKSKLSLATSLTILRVIQLVNSKGAL